MLPPTEWKTVKQPAGSKVCVAAVAAIAVGQPLEYALERMESTPSTDGDPYYRIRELLKFIGGHGIIPGMTFGVPGNNIMTWRDAFRFDFNMRDIYAIIVVKSRNSKSHFVFWDGCNVRDPSASRPEISDIKDYGVQEVYPLTYLNESAEEAEILHNSAKHAPTD